MKRIQSSFRERAVFRREATNRNRASSVRMSRREFASGLALRDRPGMTARDDDWADRIVAARKRRPFTSLEDFARDTACQSAR